jgi:cytochrome c oxidase subunit I
VHHLDEFFHRKYAEDADGNLVKVATGEEILADQMAHADAHIHMPSPSYWPIMLAFCLPIIALGVIFSVILAVVGGALLVMAAYGWAIEPSTADPSDFNAPSGPSTGVAHV